jgi:hypothetical protein
MAILDNLWYCHLCGYTHPVGMPCPKIAIYTTGYIEGEEEIKDSLKKQIDGDHYKNYSIQPAVYSYENKLGWHEGEIVKYVTRHRDKGGAKDLEKAKHLIDMLIELEYED